MMFSTSPPGRRPRTEGRVLIVDHDIKSFSELAIELRALGHRVHLAENGKVGLQLAIGELPDIILVDWKVEQLDVRTFIDLIRENPRTSTAHVYLVGGLESARFAFRNSTANLVKPFNVVEVARRLEEVLRKRLDRIGESELRGDLERVPLPDLLQLLSNREKSGSLAVATLLGSGALEFSAGMIVKARWGSMEGEKALHRLLQSEEGSFVFRSASLAFPQQSPGSLKLRVEQALMNTAIQTDELKRLLSQLPPLASLVRYVEPPEPSTEPRSTVLPVNLLVAPQTIAEVMDESSLPDADALREVERCLNNGLLVSDHDGQDSIQLASGDETLALSAGAARLRRRGFQGVIRIAVASTDPEDVQEFLRGLSWIEEFRRSSEARPRLAESGFGSLGALRLEGADIEIFALPTEPQLRPVFSTLLSGVRVCLYLGNPVPKDHASILASIGVYVVTVVSDWGTPEGAAEAIREALLRSVPRTPPPPDPYAVFARDPSRDPT